MNRRAMNPFSVFALLYTVAMVLELGDKWRNPWFVGGFLLAACAVFVTGVTRVKFLIVVVAMTGFFLIFRFPEVANHVNLMLFLNVALILAIVISLVRRRDPDTAPEEDCAAIFPVMRMGLVLVYILAGFHKLNSDYLNHESSCTTSMLGSVIWGLGTRVLGIPIVVLVAAVAAFAGYRLAGHGRFRSPGNRVFTALVVGIGIAGVVAVAVVLLSWRLGAFAVAISVVAVLAVVAWELAGGLLLTVPRLQAAIMGISLAMHATLALVGFVDFGALAVALLFTFVPASYQQVLTANGVIRVRGYAVHRIHIYAGIGIAVALLAGFHAHVHRLPEISLLTGLVFNLAVFIMIWPILVTVFSPAPRPVWGGVRILDRRMPALLYIFPVLLVFFGMTSYLGLRTAGNFSMFSNLRTEGDTSNHLLLAGNPLKVWDYQEDVVWILDIDDRYGQHIHHYGDSARGYGLPAVEFRKWIYDWTKAGYQVPLTYGYRGQIHTSDDIVTDPIWRTERRTLEMILQDFRVIQPGQPNWCRW